MLGNQENVGVAGVGIGNSLCDGRPGGDGVVQGQGPMTAAGKSACCVCLYQSCGVQGCRHFGIYLLHGAQAGHNGIGVTQGVGHLHGVGYNVLFGFQIGGQCSWLRRLRRAGGRSPEPETRPRGTEPGIPQADFLVQHGF